MVNRIKIKLKKGTQSPLNAQEETAKIINILPITQAKNKDFLKIVTKKYPEQVRKWLLENYPKEKNKFQTACKIYNFNKEFKNNKE